jgi:hypothetical protein
MPRRQLLNAGTALGGALLLSRTAAAQHHHPAPAPSLPAGAAPRTPTRPHHDHAVVDGLDEVVDATEALEQYEEHRFDKQVKDGGAK